MIKTNHKVALVTGAGSGMGEATALLFVKDGFKVVLADMNEKAILNVEEKIKVNGGTAISVKCDVSDEKQMESLVDTAVKTFGRLDAAFNNAGIQVQPAETADILAEDFDRIISVNLRGCWLSMKYEIRQMLKNGGGTIINNSSIAGLGGSPTRAAYSAAKHGILGLTRTAAAEYATRGIRVNAVCPGTINTPMVERMLKEGDLDEQVAIEATPMRRFAHSNEVASVVLFLSSDASSYINGHHITIDGGQTII